VLVIHENRGLTDHIRSVAGRLAGSGFSALAIDLLSEEGGTASFNDSARATAALNAAPPQRFVADMKAGVDELLRRGPAQRVGAVGFCFGGAMVWSLLAAGEPRLYAAAPFYGPLPGGAGFAGSPNAAVLAVYAEQDGRVNATRADAQRALQAAGLIHEIETYPGVNHAFFNDTGGRYNAAAAAQAYRRLTDWFGRHLTG
jgi:carboxymethylenebutenolidase